MTGGYELVASAEEADVVLLNTCSIREKAQEKVFHQLGRWRALKEKNPELVIGVGGCVASQEGDELRKRAPFVDIALLQSEKLKSAVPMGSVVTGAGLSNCPPAELKMVN